MNHAVLTKVAPSDSERLLQSIIQHMGDGLIAINERGIIQIFNPAAEKMFGYTADETVGKNINMLMPEPHHSRHDSYLGSYRSRGTSNVVGVVREFEAMHKDGSAFPIEITITEMPMAEKYLYTATIRDISERRRMEDELRIVRERLDLAWRGTGDGTWDWNIKTGRVIFSDRWKELLGFKPDELHGYNNEWRERIHPEDKESVIAAVEAHWRGEAPYDKEYRIRTKSGEYRWFRSRGAVIRDEQGNPARMVGSFTDITEHKMAEDIRQGLIKQLTQANEQLEQFAYVASHDLREPLRVVVSLTDLLFKEYADSIGKEGKDYMMLTRQSAKKMEAMVADLLEYSRLNHAAERLTEIDCNKKLQFAREALGEAIRSTGAVIEAGPLPKVIGNPLRFSRLLQNLIGNAIKYQRSGSTPVIRIAAEDRSSHWQFSVVDNGIGIKLEYLESIFGPFKRLHSDREYAGTGLGLTICQKIVEELGGRIWVESVLGSGSTFYFTIPKHG